MYYFINNEFISYYGNDNFYDYKNHKSPPDYYMTGYNSDQLSDYDVNFYIIHPDEIKFTRNIIGKVINIYNDDIKLVDNKLISDKLISFWKRLSDMLFCFKNNDKYMLSKYGDYVLKLSNIVEKYLGENISNNYAYSFIISYLYSLKYNCSDKFIKIMAMYITTKIRYIKIN